MGKIIRHAWWTSVFCSWLFRRTVDRFSGKPHPSPLFHSQTIVALWSPTSRASFLSQNDPDSLKQLLATSATSTASPQTLSPICTAPVTIAPVSQWIYSHLSVLMLFDYRLRYLHNRSTSQSSHCGRQPSSPLLSVTTQETVAGRASPPDWLIRE